MLKSRRIHLAGHAVHPEEMRTVFKILVENLKEATGIDSRILLK
jgi:hypothetical protein